MPDEPGRVGEDGSNEGLAMASFLRQGDCKLLGGDKPRFWPADPAIETRFIYIADQSARQNFF